MKSFAVLLVFLLPINFSSQTTEQTFMSPDGTFRFQYYRSLIPCTKHKGPADAFEGWFPADSCSAFIPVCEDPSVAIACFAYPKSAFQDYPTFEAAAFSVAEVKKADTEKSCLDGSPDWENVVRRRANKKNMNGITFKWFEIGDAATGHSHNMEVYRNFHNGQCYQLSISISSHSGAAYDPPVKDISAKMRAGVIGRLRHCINTFRFLK